MDSNENDVVEITDINSILADEKVEKIVCNCSTIYVDSINEFINKIKDGYD